MGACEQAVGFHTAAAAGCGPAAGWALLGQVLLSQGWSALLLGQAGLAGPAAEEAARLLAENGSPLWAACAQLVQAVLAGRRGDTTTAAELTAQARHGRLSTSGVSHQALMDARLSLSAAFGPRRGNTAQSAEA